MNEVIDFIVVKKLKVDLLLKTLQESLIHSNSLQRDLYVSILPPIDDFYMIEFADFLPVTRYRDISSLTFLMPVARTFNKVFFFYKNNKTGQSKYQKYIKGRLEQDRVGEKALDKGLRFDLVLEVDDIIAHLEKAWSCDYDESAEKPKVFQLIESNKVLEMPKELNYKEFYSNG